MTKDQAQIVKMALEEYFRLRMGQWCDFAHDLAFTGYNDNSSDDEFSQRLERRQSAEGVFRAAMVVAQPMPRYGRLPEQAMEMMRAQDIWQVVPHGLWMEQEHEENDWCTDAHDPQCMTGEKLPVFRKIEGKDKVEQD